MSNPLEGIYNAGRRFINGFSGEGEEREARRLRARVDASIDQQRGMIPGEWDYDPRSVFGGDGVPGIQFYAQPSELTDNLQGYDPTLIGPSAFNDLGGQDERDRLAGYQDQSIEGVLGIAEEGGLSAIDRARIAEQRAGEDQWLRGQRGAQMAEMEARGLGGSGAEMASIFDQQQASANRNMLRGTQIEGMAQERQDAARRDAFNMATGQRGQSFGEASDVASANDTVNRLNSQLGTEASRYFAEVQNQGATSEWNRTNDTNNANTDIYNEGIYTDVGNDNSASLINREDDWNIYGANANLGVEQRRGWGSQADERMAAAEADDARLFNAISGGVRAAAGIPGGGGGGSGGASSSSSALTAQPSYVSHAPGGGYKYQSPSDLMEWQDDDEDEKR